jgi:hypothetical protein
MRSEPLFLKHGHDLDVKPHSMFKAISRRFAINRTYRQMRSLWAEFYSVFSKVKYKTCFYSNPFPDFLRVFDAARLFNSIIYECIYTTSDLLFDLYMLLVCCGDIRVP